MKNNNASFDNDTDFLFEDLQFELQEGFQIIGGYDNDFLSDDIIACPFCGLWQELSLDGCCQYCGEFIDDAEY